MSGGGCGKFARHDKPLHFHSNFFLSKSPPIRVASASVRSAADPWNRCDSRCRSINPARWSARIVVLRWITPSHNTADSSPVLSASWCPESYQCSSPTARPTSATLSASNNSPARSRRSSNFTPAALGRRLKISDEAGYGADIRPMEWRLAVEKKLEAKSAPVPEKKH